MITTRRDWMKTLPDYARLVLREPIYLSAIASLGLHGLLWVILPILPIRSSEPSEVGVQRPVDLVELTPQELARLPDFATDPSAFPALPPGADLYSLNPLPGSNSLTPVPGLPSAPPSASLLPPFFAPPPLPSTTNFDFPALPPVPQDAPPLVLEPEPLGAPPADTIPPPSPLPEDAPSAPATDPVPEDGTEAPPDGDMAARPEPTAEPTVSPTASPTAEGSIPSPNPSPSPARELLLARNRELQELYAFNEAGTGEGEARSAYVSWFEGAVNWLGDDWDEKNAREIEIAGAYPKAACRLENLRGTAVVGVLVDASGAVVGDPEPRVLQSSGYRILNQRALEAAKRHRFEAAETNRAYLVAVTFAPNPEVCPSQDAEPAAQ